MIGDSSEPERIISQEKQGHHEGRQVLWSHILFDSKEERDRVALFWDRLACVSTDAILIGAVGGQTERALKWLLPDALPCQSNISSPQLCLPD